MLIIGEFYTCCLTLHNFGGSHREGIKLGFELRTAMALV